MQTRYEYLIHKDLLPLVNREADVHARGVIRHRLCSRLERRIGEAMVKVVVQNGIAVAGHIEVRIGLAFYG